MSREAAGEEAMVLLEEYNDARAALGSDGSRPGLVVETAFMTLMAALGTAIELHRIVQAVLWVFVVLLVVAAARAKRTVRRWRAQERERLTLAEAERLGADQ